MTAQGGEYGAGIGGGDESTGPQMEIYGGEINATGGDKGAGIGGGCDRGAASIIIWGGTVHAKGGLYAAGIGEGYDASSDSSAGLIVIRNCEFIGATGGNMAAGIGGGYYNNTEIRIYIFGGKKIIAYGGSNNDTGAAGIGGGSFKEISAVQGEGGDFGGYIYIGGGEVQAYGTGTYASFTGTNSGAAGLGAGYGGNMTGIIEISGGTVVARGAYGGAAIDAGAEDFAGYGGECEGRVSITGGSLELSFLHNDEGDKAVPIGHGCDGETNGTLTLGNDLCVTLAPTDTVETAQRENTLRSYTGALPVWITECEHENVTYTPKDTQTHTVKCQNCKYTGEDIHIFYNGPCVCGAEGYGVFFYNCGVLCAALMSYGHGGTVEPPEDPVREGLIFDGWYLYGESGGEPYDFSQPINEDVFLEARWLVSVEATVYDRTTQRFGVGGKISFGGQEPFVTSGNVRMDEDQSVDIYARADDGYEFVGWAYKSAPDDVFAASNVLGLTASTNMRLCAVFEEHVHTLRHYDYEAPQCEWNGYGEYWYCTGCGKYFDSEDCAHEIGEDDMTIPATGHDWSAEWAWAKDFSSATATLTCSRCPAEETLEAEITVNEETGVYTASVLYDDETFTDTRTVVTLTFDMGGKCDNYVVKAVPGEMLVLYYSAASSAAKADGFWFEGVTPLPPENYADAAAFTAANRAVFYSTVPETDTVYYVNWRTLVTSAFTVSWLKCGASLDEALPGITLAEPERYEVKAQRWYDEVTGAARGGQEYQMYVCLNALHCWGFDKNESGVNGAGIAQYETNAVQDYLVLNVTAQHYTDETSLRTENEIAPATATAAGVKEICVYCAGGCGEVVERYTETIPAAGEPDTPDEPTQPTDPADPGTPSGDNICQWDNKDHGASFWGRLVKFFHSILYFFAHLFGRR